MSAGFIVKDPPVFAGSWTLHIKASGPQLDSIYFEILDVTSLAGPFEHPGADGTVEHFGLGHTLPLPAGSGVLYSHTQPFVTEAAFDGEVGFDLHFAGDGNRHADSSELRLLPLPLHQSWQGQGADQTNSAPNRDWRDADPGSPPNIPMMPLPAPVWLGALGLLGVLALRRRLR